METQLLAEFEALYEKQDLLSKLTDHALYSSLGYSEIHSLAAIDALGTPKAAAIAARLGITRGAASKVLKKLGGRGMVEVFQRPENKKEKYYRLTRAGQEANARHTLAHRAWEKRDTDFLKGIPEDEKRAVLAFIKRFNAYLQKMIEEKTT